jgi:hypothetical protein
MVFKFLNFSFHTFFLQALQFTSKNKETKLVTPYPTMESPEKIIKIENNLAASVISPTSP